jgi:restriction endonuclease Mrr
MTARTALKGGGELCEAAPAGVALIDGEQLADHMIEHRVGVATPRIYKIKWIDQNDFNSTDL